MADKLVVEDKYYLFTLPNGLRVVVAPGDSAVSYCGVVVRAGSRDETIWGTAHFVEHTIFKGTTHRSSLRINNRMESIGGELNAYTTKEETVIYTTAPGGYLDRSLELLADLVANCTFPTEEINREKEVVIEEIQSYLDSPADRVFDEYEDLCYAGSSLGHNILGTPESVRSLNGTECRGFIDKFYTPDNLVVYISDSSPIAKIEALVNRYWGGLHFSSSGDNRMAPMVCEPFDLVRDYSGHQAHTLTGVRVFDKYDERRWALYLLNNYLGGPAMNSRLNQQMREKRGYVYTVESIISMGSDFGNWQVYFGCDKSMVNRCLKIVRRELEILANSPMKPATFAAVRRQYCGQLHVSSQHREARTMALGKSLLYYNRVHDVEYTAQRISEVTAEQMREMAEMLLSTPMSRLTLI